MTAAFTMERLINPTGVARDLRFTPQELAEAIASGTYDSPSPMEHNGPCQVPSFQDFDRRRRHEVATAHGVHLYATYQALPDEGLRPYYNSYIAGRYNRGVYLPPRLWRLLSPRVRAKIANTRRGQRRGQSVNGAIINDL